MDTRPTRLTELSRAESMRLLASVPIGRVVFTQHALPAVRPVNHLVEGDDVVIRTHPGAAIVSAADPAAGVIVAYEADEISVAARTGWSVIVTGVARLVDDAGDTSRYDAVLQPWAAGDMTQIIRISTDIVSGYRLEHGPVT